MPITSPRFSSNERRDLLGFSRFDALGTEPDVHRVGIGVVTRPHHHLAYIIALRAHFRRY